MKYRIAALLPFVVAAGCATTPAVEQHVERSERRAEAPRRKTSRVEEGIASYYADALHGRTTASGQRYDREKRTCAHRKHAFGTILEVEVVDTGRKVECRVNDRGPFVQGRVIDVSHVMARELDLVERGLAKVRVRKIR